MNEKKPLKVLFLCMTCQDQTFSVHVPIIKETWGKDIIEGKYGENVNIMFYDGWDNKHTYDKENHYLHVRCEDDIDSTFKKTYYAFSLIQNNFDYDYIFRTNTSTYINVPLALKLIEYIDNTDDTVLWTPEMLAMVEAPVPYPLHIYGRGNGLILSRKLINIILTEGLSHLYDTGCDDILIGNVLNCYWIKHGENYLDHIKNFGHSWFRCIENTDFTNHHQLCEFYNEDTSFDFIKKFITIQIKQYYHRSDESENYRELYNKISEHVDKDIDKTLEDIIEYSKNPDVFIGSILGYITMKYYIETPKQKLWDLECANKAINDPNREKFINKKWY